MKAGRPKLKLEMSDSALEEIVNRLKQSGLKQWQKDRLLAVRMAAKGDASCSEIAEFLGRARSAVQRWIHLFRECRGDLDRYLKMRRRRVSPLRDLGIAKELMRAYPHEVKYKSQAADWLLRKYGLKRSPSTMQYWLADAPLD
jgi:transposase